jgi:hypothetical protein
MVEEGEKETGIARGAHDVRTSRGFRTIVVHVDAINDTDRKASDVITYQATPDMIAEMQEACQKKYVGEKNQRKRNSMATWYEEWHFRDAIHARVDISTRQRSKNT